MTKRPETISTILAGVTFSQGSDTEVQKFMADAACKSIEDPDTFFSEQKDDIAIAKIICASCPVKAPCLVYGSASKFGIFGGLTPAERADQASPKQPRTSMITNQSQTRYLLKAPVSQIAARYGVQPRTVQRWRKIIRQYELKGLNETQL